ncbi:MAG: isopenicillin N synthase family dioxygenase [Myxococcales bacterium]
MAHRNIPTISLADYTSGDPERKDRFVQAFGQALIEFGFVGIKDHGVPDDLIRRTYTAIKAFFALPEETKRRYEIPGAGGQRGYTPFGREHAKTRTAPDLKEFFHVGRDLPPNHPHRSAYGDNVWPEEVPEFRTTTQALYTALDDAAAEMLEALALYFRIEPDYFKNMAKGGNSILRPIHYPPLSPDAPRDAVRAAEHEDINLITLLCEGTASGLQILTRQGEWIDIETTEGSIIVDSGDMLFRATNGVVPSTTHRVVNPPAAKNTERYSIPFFVHPYPECQLDALPLFVTEENPRRWPAITADGFLRERLREIGLLK